MGSFVSKIQHCYCRCRCCCMVFHCFENKELWNCFRRDTHTLTKNSALFLSLHLFYLICAIIIKKFEIFFGHNDILWTKYNLTGVCVCERMCIFKVMNRLVWHPKFTVLLFAFIQCKNKDIKNLKYPAIWLS